MFQSTPVAPLMSGNIAKCCKFHTKLGALAQRRQNFKTHGVDIKITRVEKRRLMGVQVLLTSPIQAQAILDLTRLHLHDRTAKLGDRTRIGSPCLWYSTRGSSKLNLAQATR